MNTITVLPARRVITMDPGRPSAEAVAVAGGKVLPVAHGAAPLEIVLGLRGRARRASLRPRRA